MSKELDLAKQALDTVINKSRVHLYKPIQIAEILFKQRTQPELEIDLANLSTYRNPSKKWRDDICIRFLGRVSTSSAKFQDNLFEANALPPQLLAVLGQENIAYNGIVEAYIYQAFEQRYGQLNEALNYCLKNSPATFDIEIFLACFWQQPGLKRSLDKVFEIVVYALFEVLISAIEVKIDVYYIFEQQTILQTFAEFADKVLNLTPDEPRKTLPAHFHRVGVTNAADRGLDMYANFGAVVQVKHLSLDEELAENVVTSITADKIIIVCKSAEQAVIRSLLTQIGWRTRIQAIVTVDELIVWYEQALRGEHSHLLGDKLLTSLANEIKTEFPSIGNADFQAFKIARGYDRLSNDYWDKKP